MTILSDRQIRNLCYPSLCRYKTAEYSAGAFGRHSLEEDFFGSEEEFLAFTKEQLERYQRTVIRIETTPGLFKPMITPFINGQVREIKIPRAKLDKERCEIYDYDIALWLGEKVPPEISNPIISAMKKAHWLHPLSDVLAAVKGPQVNLNKMSLQINKAITVGTTVEQLADIIYDNVLELENVPSERIISYGLSSYGYDLRCGNKFKIFTNVNTTVINPKNFDKRSFVDYEGDVCIIPPNSFVLAASMERMTMPDNTTGIVLGKSTYARCGVECLATPLEAGWEGHVTLEFANTTPLPAMLFAGEGCCQVVFLQGEACEITYAARNGKYQNQEAGPVIPRV